MPGTRREGLKPALLEYMKSRPDKTATNAECIAALSAKLGYDVPQSSIRQALQDKTLYEPIGRGVHRVKGTV